MLSQASAMMACYISYTWSAVSVWSTDDYAGRFFQVDGGIEMAEVDRLERQRGLGGGGATVICWLAVIDC